MKSLVKLVLFGFGILSINSCTSDKAKQAEENSVVKPNVITASVKAVNYNDNIRATGYLAYNNEYKLGFKTGGVIEDITVKEGQFVKSGTIMASLKLDEISAKVSQSEIAVAKAKRDYKRAQALYADSVATLEQLQNAESQLHDAEMNRQTAKFNYQQSKITAPGNGVVQKVLLDANEAAAPGNPVIVFGAENTGKVLITNISDANVVRIKVGDNAKLQFDPYPKTIFEGEIIEIAGMATPATGTFEVKIQVNDPEQKLMPGFIGSASIHSSLEQHWYKIPVEALVSANDDTAVIYISEKGLATERTIIVERILSDALLVSGDISDNDLVVVSGQHRLSGKSVEVTEL